MFHFLHTLCVYRDHIPILIGSGRNVKKEICVFCKSGRSPNRVPHSIETVKMQNAPILFHLRIKLPVHSAEYRMLNVVTDARSIVTIIIA